MKRFVLIPALLLAAALAALAVPPWHAGEALLVLADLGAGNGPSLLKTVAPPPERRPVSFGGRHGDLYLPGDKAGAAIVLVPGAAKTGKDDPRLVALANTLARARFLVLVPDIPSLRALEVSASDREPILEAVRWLASERHPPSIGVAAISYAAAPAVLAALAEPRVDFVVAVGGAYDLTQVVTFFVTGHYREEPGQPWRTMAPNAYGKWVFIQSNAARMDDSGDRALLAAIAQRKMADLAAPIDDLRARLSPQGRAVMALLDTTDPEQVPVRIAALPPKIKGELKALDLASHDLSALKARLLLIHGRDDRIIPWTESAALARAAPRASLVLLDNLSHADLKAGGVADGVALWRAVVALLEERDRAGQ
ncbi:MAG: alpha/beta hydrolase [Solirubrobacterales bacterium]